MSCQLSAAMESAKPYLLIVFLQVGLAGMDILSKAALNKGMSNYVLVVYRHAVATIVIAPFAVVLDKKTRPKMTKAIFIKLLLLALLEPVIDQNLYFLGMKYTTATFAAAIINILPAVTFVMALMFRLESVKITSIYSQAKIIGTVATVAGAMIMTLINGPILDLFWTKPNSLHEQVTGAMNLHDAIKGALMITVGSLSWAFFMILQAITLKTYPVELSLTAWICLFGTIEGAVVAMVMERGNTAVWAIHWDTKLLAAVYSGIFCSGLAYYIQGVVMKDRGPVFVTAFSPLCMVIVAVMSSIIFAEQMYLGRVIGAIIIVAGLYLVVWGKSKDYKEQPAALDDQSLPQKQTISLCNDGNEDRKDEVVQSTHKIEISH